MAGPEATVGAGAGAVAWKTCRPELRAICWGCGPLCLASPLYATNCGTWGESHLLAWSDEQCSRLHLGMDLLMGCGLLVLA